MGNLCPIWPLAVRNKAKGRQSGYSRVGDSGSAAGAGGHLSADHSQLHSPTSATAVGTLDDAQETTPLKLNEDGEVDSVFWGDSMKKPTSEAELAQIRAAFKQKAGDVQRLQREIERKVEDYETQKHRLDATIEELRTQYQTQDDLTESDKKRIERRMLTLVTQRQQLDSTITDLEMHLGTLTAAQSAMTRTDAMSSITPHVDHIARMVAQAHGAKNMEEFEELSFDPKRNALGQWTRVSTGLDKLTHNLRVDKDVESELHNEMDTKFNDNSSVVKEVRELLQVRKGGEKKVDSVADSKGGSSNSSSAKGSKKNKKALVRHENEEPADAMTRAQRRLNDMKGPKGESNSPSIYAKLQPNKDKDVHIDMVGFPPVPTHAVGKKLDKKTALQLI
jgi:chromosome segregation ATPase